VFGLSRSSALITTVVVARLLTPADFGLFALALLVVNLFEYVKDLGVNAALVQSPREWNRIAPTGLTLSVVLGVISGSAVTLCAPLAAEVVNNPDVVPLIRALAIGLVILSLSAVPAAHLRRNLDFRRRIIPEFLGAVVKTALTIGMAATGFGVWSLVYGQLAASVVITIGYWWVGRARPKFGFDGDEARALIGFGAPLTVAGLIWFATVSVDYLVIGMRLGDTQLGLYTLAYRLPELIVVYLCIVISEVLFSALSRLQHDRSAMEAHFINVMTAVVALVVPISIGLAVTAPSLIVTLYGPAYSAAAPALSVLAIYALVLAASFHAGDVFKAIHRPSLLTILSVGKLAILIGPIWWAAGRSITMVAVVLLVTEMVHFVAKLLIVRMVTDLKLKQLWGAAFRPLPAGACMGVVMLGVTRLVAPLPPPAVVALTICAGLAAYLVSLRITAPSLFAKGRQAVRAARVAYRVDKREK
jgi:PST family polysaccharide transporter